MPKLGVNIDHVATIRQARRAKEPDPVWAAAVAEMNGADGITVHLREDRRHIQDRDVEILRRTVRTRLNLEMAIHPDIVRIACRIAPQCACIVPERRQEVTTEGGLDVAGGGRRLKDAVRRLADCGITVSLFIAPDPRQIEAAAKSGAPFIELHTGAYAGAREEKTAASELRKLIEGARLARQAGLRVNAGHGLDYWNVVPVARIDGMEELNIGHSIIARAVFVGLGQAVREMKALIS
ncbi:MAG: pyridoxine 5'-phosphate synthase [Planctomycetota bacterium]|nr:pyridoxine 5'-phosphate synthase [Planctomycetota bacterium]